MFVILTAKNWLTGVMTGTVRLPRRADIAKARTDWMFSLAKNLRRRKAELKPKQGTADNLQPAEDKLKVLEQPKAGTLPTPKSIQVKVKLQGDADIQDRHQTGKMGGSIQVDKPVAKPRKRVREPDTSTDGLAKRLRSSAGSRAAAPLDGETVGAAIDLTSALTFRGL
jgi:hypothetical protein